MFNVVNKITRTSEAHSEPIQTSYRPQTMVVKFEKKANIVTYFCKKLHHRCFRVLNALLIIMLNVRLYVFKVSDKDSKAKSYDIILVSLSLTFIYLAQHLEPLFSAFIDNFENAFNCCVSCRTIKNCLRRRYFQIKKQKQKQKRQTVQIKSTETSLESYWFLLINRSFSLTFRVFDLSFAQSRSVSPTLRKEMKHFSLYSRSC